MSLLYRPYRPSFVQSSLVARSATPTATPTARLYDTPAIARVGSTLVCAFSLIDATALFAVAGTKAGVCRSTDEGQTWSTLAEVTAAVWPALLPIGSDLYLLGCDDVDTEAGYYGSITIRKSTNAGATWGSSSTILAKGGSHDYGTFSQPLVHGGRVYVAICDAPDVATHWAAGSELRLLHASTSADLTNAANWSLSNGVTLTGAPGGWSNVALWEPVVLLDETGVPVVLCRVQANDGTPLVYDQAAIVRVALDGSGTPTLSWTAADLIEFEGGQTKFAALNVGGQLLAVVNSDGPTLKRQALALATADGIAGPWTTGPVLVRDEWPGHAFWLDRAGYQYPYAIADGDDVLFVERRAEPGAARKWHDANSIWFHRVADWAGRI